MADMKISKKGAIAALISAYPNASRAKLAKAIGVSGPYITKVLKHNKHRVMEKKLIPLPKTVKETVDFIYEYLIEHPDGISINMTQLLDSRTQRKIVAVLIKRSIIQKMAYSIPGKKGCQYKYKWVATMAPTKTLYGSIVSQIRDEDNNWPSHRKNEKPKQSVKEQPAVVDNQPIEAQETPAAKADEDKPTWTKWFLLEYKRTPGHFHFSKIMSSPKHGFFIYNGIGTYGWMPIAVVQPKADNARLSLFLSEIEEKNHSTEEIQRIFRDNIKPENIFGENDDLAEAMARIDPDKDIFIEPQETPTPMFTGFGRFDGFSDQELLDELKKRGYTIEDYKLVIIKKTYLD